MEGTIRSFGEVRPVGSPPAMRFTMDVTLETAAGRVQVAAWDEAVKRLRAAGLGARVRLPAATANPLLEGWWTATEPVERL